VRGEREEREVRVRERRDRRERGFWKEREGIERGEIGKRVRVEREKRVR